MRILLIEDNEDDVLTIREMLAEEKDATFDLELADCLGKGGWIMNGARKLATSTT